MQESHSLACQSILSLSPDDTRKESNCYFLRQAGRKGEREGGREGGGGEGRKERETNKVIDVSLISFQYCHAPTCDSCYCRGKLIITQTTSFNILSIR